MERTRSRCRRAPSVETLQSLETVGSELLDTNWANEIMSDDILDGGLDDMYTAMEEERMAKEVAHANEEEDRHRLRALEEEDIRRDLEEIRRDYNEYEDEDRRWEDDLFMEQEDGRERRRSLLAQTFAQNGQHRQRRVARQTASTTVRSYVSSFQSRGMRALQNRRELLAGLLKERLYSGDQEVPEMQLEEPEESEEPIIAAEADEQPAVDERAEEIFAPDSQDQAVPDSLPDSEQPVLDQLEDDDKVQKLSSRNNRITEAFGTGLYAKDGYAYRKAQKAALKSGKHAYRCIDQLCKGRVHIDETNDKGVIVTEHNHNPSQTMVDVRIAKDKLEKEARKVSTLSGSRQRRSRQRLKRKEGDMLANIEDPFAFEIPLRFRTYNEDLFMIADINDNGNRAVIFLSDFGTSLLARYKNIAFDGTFRIVPNHMLQLFTVHAFLNNRSSLPACYVVVNKKTTDLYRTVFQKSNEQFGDSGPPKSCMSDFEKASFGAARDIWPDIDVNLCHFHLGQNVYRQVQSIPGLSARYNGSPTMTDLLEF
ncbi:hypothetical protein QR680_008104 [Steinernema hermaphroditum]|uniref:MULE transposase domain-containing protein n=1 Tax=Steinernema hermaphroditum TaxID=289476 RepID=A0AA39M795_9BILA|nr:hypothetical protein QR680_008104 [Steinernema hermaphroditum]